MSWRSCQSIRAIAPAEGKEQMTPPMCFEILPILCAFFYRVSIVHVYMSAVSYLPPSNENRSSSLVLCGYQTPTTSPRPQIGPTSQRADQSALAVRGPVGRAGPPKETEGWGPLLSGAWHICIYTPWMSRLVRRQTSRGHVTRSQSMPESTLERQTGCESFALGIGGHIPRPRTTRSRGPSSR